MATTTASSPPSLEFCSFHLADWPLVKVIMNRPPAHDMEISEFQTNFCGLLSLALYGDKSTNVHPAKLRLVMCVDGIVDATLQQQLQAATFINEVKPLVLAGSLLGTALVVSSPKARAVLECIVTFTPLTSKYAIFATEADGLAWLATCL